MPAKPGARWDPLATEHTAPPREHSQGATSPASERASTSALLPNPVHRADTDAVPLGDLAHAAVGARDPPLEGVIDAGPTEHRAVGPRPGHAGTDALGDHLTFEGREHAEHAEHRATRRRARVQLLAVEIEVDPERVNFREERDEVLQRAAEAVDAPCHDDVELPLSSIAEQAVELGSAAPTLGTTDAAVLVDADDLVAHAGRDLEQLARLVLGVLLTRGDAEVDRGARHRADQVR